MTQDNLLQIQDGDTEAWVFARKKQNKNMLDLKLSFILNDVMMNDCETIIFTQSKNGIKSA